MELKLCDKEIFYLRVLLMEELKRLDNDEKIQVFRGVKMSIYMKLFEKLEKLEFVV